MLRVVTSYEGLSYLTGACCAFYRDEEATAELKFLFDTDFLKQHVHPFDGRTQSIRVHHGQVASLSQG